MKGEIHLVVGEEDFLVEKKARELLARLLKGLDEIFGLETIDGAAENADAACRAVRQCIEALSTVGFSGGRKVVWLRKASFLEDTPTARAEAVQQASAELAAMIKNGMSEGVSLLVTAPTADRRFAFFKAVAQHGTVHEFRAAESPWEAEKERAERVAAMARELGLQMSEDVLHVFLERMADNLRTAAAEMEKLALGIAPSTRPTVEDVKRFVTDSPVALVWDLTDAIGSRSLERALFVLNTLLSRKESPIGIVALLHNQTREWMIYREALDKGWVAQQAGGYGRRPSWQWMAVPDRVAEAFQSKLKKDPRNSRPFRVSRVAEQASHFSMRDFRRMHDVLISAHEELVSSRMPPRLALELAVIRMLT